MAKLLLRRSHKVTTAASSAQAHSLIEMNEGLNLLISDLGLPDGIGRDLMNEFRKKFGPAGIALAGHGTENDVAQSSIRGFLTHLKKPAHIKLSA